VQKFSSRLPDPVHHPRPSLSLYRYSGEEPFAQLPLTADDLLSVLGVYLGSIVFGAAPPVAFVLRPVQVPLFIEQPPACGDSSFPPLVLALTAAYTYSIQGTLATGKPYFPPPVHCFTARSQSTRSSASRFSHSDGRFPPIASRVHAPSAVTALAPVSPSRTLPFAVHPTSRQPCTIRPRPDDSLLFISCSYLFKSHTGDRPIDKSLAASLACDLVATVTTQPFKAVGSQR
jgi:hypothetical protein